MTRIMMLSGLIILPSNAGQEVAAESTRLLNESANSLICHISINVKRALFSLSN